VTHPSSEWTASWRGATDISRWHTISLKSQDGSVVEVEGLRITRLGSRLIGTGLSGVPAETVLVP